MAKAKKLPSGSWRCLVYSHSEPVYDDAGKPVLDPKTGKQKQKRIYESFTCNDPSPKGKRQVEKEAAAWAAEKEQQKHKQPESTLTLGEAMDNYIQKRSSVLSPATIREYKRSRKADLKNLMDVKLSDITQDLIQEEINREAKSHSPKTVKNMHGLLTAVMGAYRPDFNIRTKLPEKVRVELYVPSDDNIRDLMSAVQGTQMEIPVLLAAFGPMRRSEICALDSRNIKGNVVHVKYAMVLDENNKWVIKVPKSYAGDRYIDYPDFVIKKFEHKKGRIVDLSPAQISDRFATILEQNNIPHFRFHDLRHYSASIQHAIGVPDAYIMKRGGWGNDAVLKNIYRHTMEQQTKEMDKKTNDYFKSLCNTKCNTK